MPMSKKFENRLLPILDEIVSYYGTPFHIYDEAGIRRTGQHFIKAFSGLNGFRDLFLAHFSFYRRNLNLIQIDQLVFEE